MSYTYSATIMPSGDSIIGTSASEFLKVPSQARLLTGLPTRTLNGGDGTDSLFLVFNANLTDAAWKGVGGWENLYLYGSGYQTLVLGANFNDGLTGVLTVMASGNSGLNLDASALTKAVKVLGTLGADVIRGGDGDDHIWGLGGNDSLSGGAGNETFEFFSAAQLTAASIDGGADVDTLKLNGTAAISDQAFVNKTNLEQVIFNTAGTKSITLGSQAANAFSAGVIMLDASHVAGAITIDGSALQGQGRLWAKGGASNAADTLIGGSGDDTLVGTGGSDELYGNGGNDTLIFNSNTQLLQASVVDGGDGFDTVQITSSDYASGLVGIGANLEAIELTAGLSRTATFTAADANAFTGKIIRIAATAATDFTVDGQQLAVGSQLHVTGINNTNATGGAGNDTFTAGAGSNDFSGGAGNDTFVWADTTNLGAGVINGGSGSFDALRLLAPINLITAGMLANKTGLEAVQFDATGTISITLGVADTLFSTAALLLPNATKLNFNASALSSMNAVKVAGTGGADAIQGGAGDDVITGNGGADRLFGHVGNDTFVFTDGTQLSGASTVEGGANYDVVSFTQGGFTDAAFAKVKEIEAISFDGTGFASAQVGNTVAGAFGATVQLFAGAGITQLNVDAGALSIRNIAVYGSTGADYLLGGSGNDYFEGKGGADNIQGGAGHDSFVFGNVAQFNALAYLDGGADYDTVRVDGGTGTISDATFGNIRNIEQFLVDGTGVKTLNLGNGAAQAFGGGPIFIQALGATSLNLNASAVTNNGVWAVGGNGADTFTSSRMADYFTGGLGVDTFRFATNSGSDTIFDFKPASMVLPGGLNRTLDFTWAGGPASVVPGAGFTNGLNGVSGFTFSGAPGSFGTVDTSVYVANTVYQGAWGTSQTVGYLESGATLTIKTTGGAAFDFQSAKFAAANSNGQTVSIKGYLDGAEVAATTLGLSNSGSPADSVTLSADFDKVDEFRLTSNGGQLSFDDFGLLALGDAADQLSFSGFGTVDQRATILANAMDFAGGTYLSYDNFQSGIYLAGVNKADLALSDLIWA